MKKLNLFKTVLCVAAAMLFNAGVFGQVYNEAAYEPFNTDKTNNLIDGAGYNDSIDYVTVGSTMRYYAIPDEAYHPNYQSAGTLSANFKWAWTFPGGFPNTDTTTVGNYVETLFSNVGSYSISVTENAPPAMGSCVGSPTYLYVNIIGLPSGTMSIAPGGAWQQITLNQSYQICSSQAAQTVTVNFVEAIPEYYASYSFQVTREIDMIDGTGAVLGIAGADGTEAVIDNFPLGKGTQLSDLIEGALTNAEFEQTAPSNFAYTYSSDPLNVLTLGAPAKSYRTRYTYRVRTADNAAPFTDVSATSSFVSNILAKSDYNDVVKRSVNFTNAAISFIVNPAPVTGTIYHIPNDFSF